MLRYFWIIRPKFCATISYFTLNGNVRMRVCAYRTVNLWCIQKSHWNCTSCDSKLVPSLDVCSSLFRGLFPVTLNNTWNNITDYYYYIALLGQISLQNATLFRVHALAPPANSSLFVVLVPLVLAIYLGSGRSERRLSFRRWCEEIFERDEEIERNGKGEYTKHLDLFSVLRDLSSLVCFFYLLSSLISLLWLLHEASSLDYSHHLNDIW